MPELVQECACLFGDGTDAVVTENDAVRVGRIWIAARHIVCSPQAESHYVVPDAVQVGVTGSTGRPKVRDTHLRIVAECIGPVRYIGSGDGKRGGTHVPIRG